MAKKRKQVSARTPNQKDYCVSIVNKPVTICVGPAGTGKTHIACGMAAQMLFSENSPISRIILTRPAVCVGKEMGHFPGSADEKVAPYLQPLFDELGKYISKIEMEKMRKDGTVEIVPLAVMRGRTFNNSFIVLDESQNATMKELRMLLSRLGTDSRMVLSGDVTQSDLEEEDEALSRAAFHLGWVKEIGQIELTEEDIQRHPLIGKMMRALPEK